MRLPWRDMAPGRGPLISTSLTADETAELTWLARDAEILEIGAAYGYSAVVMALAGGRVASVDPHIAMQSLGIMRANLDAYGVTDQVTIHLGRSEDVLPRLGARRRYDLGFIDGDHRAEAVAHDIRWATKLIKPGGTLACHDYGEDTCPGVATAINAWREPDYLVDTLAVFRMEGNE